MEAAVLIASLAGSAHLTHRRARYDKQPYQIGSQQLPKSQVHFGMLGKQSGQRNQFLACVVIWDVPSA